MARGDAEGAQARSDRRWNHELIVKLGREGHTAADVARAHQEWALAEARKAHREVNDPNYGLPPTSTIYPIWHRNGVKPHVRRYEDEIPWVLRQEDLHQYIPQMLRAAARLRRGETNAPDPQKKLDKFLRKLERDGDVVHYDPKHPQARNGFVLTERREGIDTGLIRSPWFTDRGARIAKPAGLRAEARPPWEAEEPSPVIDVRAGSPVIDLRSRSRSKV